MKRHIFVTYWKGVTDVGREYVIGRYQMTEPLKLPDDTWRYTLEHYRSGMLESVRNDLRVKDASLGCLPEKQENVSWLS